MVPGAYGVMASCWSNAREWRWMVSVLLVSVLVHTCTVKCSTETEVSRTCEPIKLELCRGIGYNVTSMPNLVGHDMQKDAQLQLQTFTPLIQYGCSSQLQFFLCSVYVPMCTEKIATPIGPCRPLCESVRSRCQPVLQEFGFPWPTALNCSKFPPENNHVHMCMDGPGEETSSYPVHVPSSAGHNALSGRPGHHPNMVVGPGSPSVAGKMNNPNSKLSPNIPILNPGISKGFYVPGPPSVIGSNVVAGPCDKYRFPERYVFINRTGRCAQLCDANLAFSNEDKTFAEIWMAVWAVICFLGTLFTILTFLIDGSRFRYPERPIIFLAFCFNIYSGGHIVRLIAGRHDVACHTDPQHNVEILLQEGLDQTNCTIVFLLNYFFGMAATVWWALLTLTWFLTAGPRWTHDKIQRYSSLLHLVAWGIPAAQTIAILVLLAVDADELTGMCNVGNQNASYLSGFVIIPESICLLIGLVFLLCGSWALCQHRKPGKNGSFMAVPVQLPPSRHPSSATCSTLNSILYHQQHHHASHANQPLNSGQLQHSDKNATNALRVGIFGFLYVIPSVCVLASHLYEYYQRESWLLLTTGMQSPQRPTIEVFMLKIFMSLMVGLICALWVWSAKTLTAWKKLGRRLSHRKQPVPAYLQAGSGGTGGNHGGMSGTGPVTAVHAKQQVLLLDKHKRFKASSKSGSETAV